MALKLVIIPPAMQNCIVGKSMSANVLLTRIAGFADKQDGKRAL